MDTSSRIKVLQITNVVSFVITILANLLSGLFRVEGKTVGDISDLYPTLVTPAGYVFSIWGIIYGLLTLFTAYQALPKQRDEAFIQRISIFFALSNVVNSLWLLLWLSEQITLSLILMFVLLALLLIIYTRLRIGRSTSSLKERVFVHLPFSVYLGWITVASIGNAAAALVAAGWDGWGVNDSSWAMIMLTATTLLTLAIILKRGDAAYSLVILWALVGIIVKHGEVQSIVSTASAGIAIILVALIVKTLKEYLYPSMGS